MVEIIPAILENDIRLVEKRLKQVEPFVQQVQLDIADGKYVPNDTLFTAEDFQSIVTPLSIELHMMVRDPEMVIPSWCAHPRLNRIIVHSDSTENIDTVIDLIRSCGKEVGIAINPNQSVQSFLKVYEKALVVQVMGINPGFTGQKFLSETIERIRELHKMRPDIIISVDGGLTLENIQDVVKAGASRIVAYTLIFQNDAVELNINKIKQLIV